MKTKFKISIKGVIEALSFAVLIIIIASGYFLYTSYTKFEDSKKLSKYINISNDHSTLLINKGKEQLQSSVYVLSKNSIPFVKEQMIQSRFATNSILNKIKSYSNLGASSELENLVKLLKQLDKKRGNINKFKLEDKYFKQINLAIIKYQNIISDFDYIKELKAEIKGSILISRAINRNIIENSIISSYISIDKPIPLDRYNYLKEEIQSIDSSLPIELFKINLFKNINRLAYTINKKDIVENRKVIDWITLKYYNTNKFYGYTIDINDWSDTINQHILYLNEMKTQIDKYIHRKVQEIKQKNLHIFIFSLILFIFSIILQLGSLLVERGLQNNTQTLSHLLSTLANFIGIDKQLDITTNEGQKEAYKVIEKSIQQIEEEKQNANKANRAKSLFLANMSHEIRTPMNGVLGFLDLLRATPLDKNQIDYINTIDISAKNLLLIINQILDISKIESDKMELYEEEFDPCKEFSDTINIFSAKTAQENITLSVYIDPQLPKVIKGDVLKLKEILTNLLSNAIKFTEPHGEVNVQIVLKKLTDKARIYFEVQDTGIGMTPKQVEKIFEPFVQADLSTTKNYGGTGLGMTIVKKYIEMMGGKIDVKSKYKSGTRFFYEIDFEVVERDKCVTQNIDKYKVDFIGEDSIKNKFIKKYFEYFNVQIHDIEKIEEISQLLIISQNNINTTFIKEIENRNIKYILFTSFTEREKIKDLNPITTFFIPIFPEYFYKIMNKIFKQHNIAPSNPLKNKKAMLVEDNLINQQLMSIILNDLEMKYQLIFNGQDAIEEYIKNYNKYDIIFMDISMPLVDGIKATKAIRKFEKEHLLNPIPIVALTANVLEKDRLMFFEAGGNYFLAKPTTQTVLISTLSQIFQ